MLPEVRSRGGHGSAEKLAEELIPEMSEGEHSNIGVVMFALGFVLMMILDVALGCAGSAGHL